MASLAGRLCTTLQAFESVLPQHGGSDWMIDAGRLRGDFLTLDTEQNCVRWYSEFGIRVVRSYSLASPPLQAVFCLFSDAAQLVGGGSAATQAPSSPQHLGVAILTNEFELEIHYQSGEKFELLLPVAASFMASTPFGLLLQISRQQQTLLIPSPVVPPNNAQSASCAMHILIRSPRSPMEMLPRLHGDDGQSAYDLEMVCSSHDTICLRSPQSLDFYFYRLSPSHPSRSALALNTSAPEDGPTSLSIMETSHTPHSSDLMDAASPFFDISNRSNSGLLNTSNQSKRSSQASISSSRRKSSSQPLLERASSAGTNSRLSFSPTQYNSETLQSLLGVKAQPRLVGRASKPSRPSTSSFSKRSSKSHTPSRVSASFLEENEHSHVEEAVGLDSCLENSTAWCLQLITKLSLADYLPADCAAEGPVQFQLARIGVLKEHAPAFDVCIPSLSLLARFCIEPLFHCLSLRQEPSMGLSGSLSCCSVAWGSGAQEEKLSLTLWQPKSPDQGAIVFSSVVCGSIPWSALRAVASPTAIAGITTLAASLPFLAVRLDDGRTCLVHISQPHRPSPILRGLLPVLISAHTSGLRGILENVDSELKKQAKRAEEDKDGRILHRSLYLVHSLQTIILCESRSAQVMLWWIALLFRLPYQAIESFVSGDRTLAELSWELSKPAFDDLLSQIGGCLSPEAAEALVASTIHLLMQVWQEVWIRFSACESRRSVADSEEREEMQCVLDSLAAFARFCIGHQMGDLQAWLRFQGILPASSELLTRPSVVTWLEALLCDEGATTSTMATASMAQQVHREGWMHSTTTGLQGPFVATRLLLTWGEQLLVRPRVDASTSPPSALRIVQSLIHCLEELTGHPSAQITEDEFTVCFHLLPLAIRSIVLVALVHCDQQAQSTWPKTLLLWTGRADLLANRSSHLAHSSATSASPANATNLHLDGLDEVETASLLRFPDDERVHEACRMLRTCLPQYLKVERAPEDSETERRQKIQIKLIALTKRSLACSVGRGMVTIGTMQPVMAEALPIPCLSLSGRLPPTNTIVHLDASATSADQVIWPEFHNGVAAALRIGIRTHAVPGLVGEDPSIDGDSMRESSGPSSQQRVPLARVTRNWILYNKTNAIQSKLQSANSTTPVNDPIHGHAGFLYGLGLQGHLHVLSVPDICDYLTQGQESTTIAVLIGVAASKMGSADSIFSKTLCLHLPSLLPLQHWDIEISPVVQCAALVGLGLLYLRSGHRLMVEFLLEELARRPTSDRCEHREALALAAAWSLALVLLPSSLERDGSRGTAPADPAGNVEADHSTTSFSTSPRPPPPPPTSTSSSATSGETSSLLHDLVDLNIEDRLFALITGGARPQDPKVSLQEESDISGKSSRILETPHINTDSTAPAGCIALGLIFMKTKQAKVLRFLQIPTTKQALDSLRPDLLLTRAIAICLIQWDDIPPTAEWLEEQVPKIVRDGLSSARKENSHKVYRGPYGNSRLGTHVLTPATSFLLYVHIITGYCMGLGLLYAGTFDAQAKKTILDRLLWLQSIRDGKSLAQLGFQVEKSHRVAVDMCVSALALSLACVMAGSGDLDCMRTFRELRWKLDDVTYGTHMALSMSLGLLFLSGGRYSLKRDPLSVACLLLAILPRYPARAHDQQYHLQALRHMYLLAAEPRVLHTIDIDTCQPVGVDLQLQLIDGGTCLTRAPGLLPELAAVRRIHVLPAGSTGVRYYSCVVDVPNGEGESAGRDGGAWQGRRKKTGQSMQGNVLAPLFVKRLPDRRRSRLEEKGEDKREGDSAGSEGLGAGQVSARKALEQLLDLIFGEANAGPQDEVNRVLATAFAKTSFGLEVLAQSAQC